jgi:uncharacterized membrane protein
MSSLRSFIRLELRFFTIILATLVFLGLFPRGSFDDVFLQKTGLIPYLEFRPGYPPIGKLPYYSAYVFFLQTSLHAIYVLLFNGITLFLLSISLYFCLLKVNKNKAVIVGLSILLMPSVIYLTFVYSRADALSVIFSLCVLYFFENPWLCGVFCGLGTLTKLYPAMFLLPLLLYHRGFKKKAVLLYSFTLTLLLVSLPFLLSDPLMYISVVLSHGLRGPSESIFALIDGYLGHTGFLHPTFDASFYSWQFATLYEPNSSDHFRYQWNIPILPYISLALQLASMIAVSWIARKKESRGEAIMLLSLAMFSYFAFSTFYNPIIHIPQICFLAIATSNWNKRTQLLTLTAFEAVNAIHSLVWFSPTFIFIGLTLPLSIAIMLRTILYLLVFLNFARRKGI